MPDTDRSNIREPTTDIEAPDPSCTKRHILIDTVVADM